MARKKSTRHYHPQPSVPARATSPEEQMLDQAMHEVMEEMKAEGVDLNEMLGALMPPGASSGGALPPLSPLSPMSFDPETPLEEAEALVMQAMTATGRRRTKLAKKALKISPDCTDAYIVLAEEARDPHEVRDLLEQAVQAAERRLAPDALTGGMEAYMGTFEADAYMHARGGLAGALWNVGEREQAITHVQDMLQLDPMDYSGHRYTLALWLLAAGDDAALEPLLDEFDDGFMSGWIYTRALMLYRRDPAGDEARQELMVGLATNIHVGAYLLEWKPLPDHLLEFIMSDNESEASSYVMSSREIWKEVNGALAWLAEVAAPLEPFYRAYEDR